VPNTCVIGLQWGDEAKGKLVDLLTPRFEIVVRYQGGAVVVNPPTILGEIDGLADRGVDVHRNLMLSNRAHVVMPWHVAEDKALDSAKVSGESLGTTLRGIGPCYRDKVGRSFAIRLGDMYRDDFRDKIAQICDVKRQWLTGLSGGLDEKLLDADAVFQEYRGYAERLRPLVKDTNAYLLDEVEAGRALLFEGAQGALLDVDHGTFPFVTSSNSSGVGVSAGSGIPGRWIERVLGVTKAYTTRVGGGPFPTELDDEIGDHIRQEGNEYGTTTGRPRRCGWFDAVAVRYTARLSGVDLLSLMMLDVLSKLPELKVCVAYELGGERIEHFLAHADDLRQAKPIYETLPGWQEDVTGVRNYADLPKNARGYVERISELVGRPVGVVSVGPDRAQTIFAEMSLSPAAAAG